MGHNASAEDSFIEPSNDPGSDDRDASHDIVEEIRQGASPRFAFYLMNLFATIIAAYGLISDSTPVVIGAMVIAVLLGPIADLGYALISADRRLLSISLFTIVSGAAEVFTVAYLIGTIHSTIPLTTELLSRTQPNLFDLIIAFSGGAAGAYATGRRVPGGTMIGVAIATALVPPLSASAIAGAQGNWSLSREAFLLFLTNFIAIQCAYSLVLYALRLPHTGMRRSSRRRILTSILPSITLFIALAIMLTYVLERRIEKQRLDSQVRRSIQAALVVFPGCSLGDLIVQSQDSAVSIIASVRTPSPLGPPEVRELEQQVRSDLHIPSHLTVRSILMRVANRSNYLYEPEELKIVFDQPQSVAKLDSAVVDSTIVIDSTGRSGDSTTRSLDSTSPAQHRP